MKVLTGLGRFIYGIPFIVFGIFHFMNAGSMAGYVLKGWPIATALVYLSGAALILAGVAIVVKIYARLACILLAVLLLIFILALHVPGLASESSSQLSMTMLLKDASLMGAALYIGATIKK